MARVLIIEDDGALQQMLSETLFKEGYEVHYAFNGKEGYDKCIGVDPDLILLDLMLPVLNGVEVLKRLSANTLLKDIPVIVMTGHSDRNELLKGSITGYGIRDYIQKPFELRDMARLIDKALSQGAKVHAKVEVVAKGVVRLDLRFRTVWVNNKLVGTISRTRVELLKLLIAAKGGVKKEKLLSSIWGTKGTVAALEKTIQRLRQDLKDEAKRIQTTSEGYELIG